MGNDGKSKTWKLVRGWFHTVHLWLGVGSALILFVVCLTGTVYTFSSEIQKMTDAHLYEVDVKNEAQPLSSQNLISNVLDSLGGGTVQSIVMPAARNSSVQITIAAKKVDNGEGKGSPRGRQRGTTYFVNPYSGEILGTTETNSSEFFMVMFRMHRWLLLDTAVGRPIVGVATLIFVVIILSGLVIWFPKKVKSWRQGLKIKTSANWKRINHDLHTSLGLYSSLFLLVMALTGLTWSFEWYKTGFRNFFGGSSAERTEFLSEVAPEKDATIEDYVAAATQALPYEGDCRVMLPSDPAGVVTVTKTSSSFFATSVADRVTIDQYSAKVLHTDVFADKPLNQKILSSVKALHVGSFYGTFSKIIYFITCLIATSLPVTGVVIWINKLRKKNQKKEAAGISEKPKVSRTTGNAAFARQGGTRL